jgi:deferrochelatase/peroxidase EfeB
VGPRLTRREVLAAAGGGALALAAGGGGAVLAREERSGRRRIVPFYGEHQGGIATAAQDRLVFGAFDVTLSDRRELAGLLRDWTVAASRLTEGEPVAALNDELPVPPLDTGEALGLDPAQLTVTFGLGPSLFEHAGLGLGARRPDALVELPHFPGDQLEPSLSGGDLCVQACSDDPQVAFHAVRNLARIARGRVVLRWLQLGFGRTSATTEAQTTPRNLQGFKDGTNNLRGDDEQAMRAHVWVGDDEPRRWLRGGTYLVARRIRMLIEVWDRSSLDDQQRTIGRFKASGAPLTGGTEHSAVDLGARRLDGAPVIPTDAHIRHAAPSENGGERILRRGYSFTDGIDPITGELDAGLFFVAFQRDPRRQFVAIQRRLASLDALNEYIVHTGSALFAVPPGAERGGFVGEALLA